MHIPHIVREVIYKLSIYEWDQKKKKCFSLRMCPNMLFCNMRIWKYIYQYRISIFKQPLPYCSIIAMHTCHTYILSREVQFHQNRDSNSSISNKISDTTYKLMQEELYSYCWRRGMKDRWKGLTKFLQHFKTQQSNAWTRSYPIKKLIPTEYRKAWPQHSFTAQL